MTIDQLRSWMEGAEKNREWLSDKIGASKRTIDNWFFSGETPEMAQRLIERIITEEAVATPKFAPTEWKQIMDAMKASGYESYEEFFKSSIIEMAKDPSRISRRKQ